MDELDEVPDDATVIFSAHGIAPEVREEGVRRGLRVIDATCPLVTKVHLEAIRYAREDYSIVLIGHEDHDEVIGTLGEAPERIFVIANVDEVARLEVPNPDKVAYLTQTTLSVDDTRDVIEALRRKFPEDRRPLPQRHLLRDPESSGGGQAPGQRRRPPAGHRLGQQLQRHPARRGGADGRHPGPPHQRRRRHQSGVARRMRARIGITAGASTPEVLVTQTVEALRGQGVSVREVHVVEEDVRFALPQELARMAEERGMTLPARTAMRQNDLTDRRAAEPPARPSRAPTPETGPYRLNGKPAPRWIGYTRRHARNRRRPRSQR